MNLDTTKPWAVFLDIDGTLMKWASAVEVWDSVMSAENAEAIARARQNGHKVLINTGRGYACLPRQLAEQEYFDEHPVMYLLTPEADYRIELIAGFMTSSDSEVYDPMESESERREFIDSAVKNSLFKSNVSYSLDDKYVCLSTCSYDYENARLMLVGKLVKL